MDYKDRFKNRTDEELKDIISGRFDDFDTDAIEAAIALLKERQSTDEVPLEKIPKLPIEKLQAIIDNPEDWSERALDVAQTAYLARQHKTISNQPKISGTGKTVTTFFVILAIGGALLFCFFMYYFIYFFWWLSSIS